MWFNIIFYANIPFKWLIYFSHWFVMDKLCWEPQGRLKNKLRDLRKNRPINTFPILWLSQTVGVLDFLWGRGLTSSSLLKILIRIKFYRIYCRYFSQSNAPLHFLQFGGGSSSKIFWVKNCKAQLITQKRTKNRINFSTSLNWNLVNRK